MRYISAKIQCNPHTYFGSTFFVLSHYSILIRYCNRKTDHLRIIPRINLMFSCQFTVVLPLSNDLPLIRPQFMYLFLFSKFYCKSVHVNYLKSSLILHWALSVRRIYNSEISELRCSRNYSFCVLASWNELTRVLMHLRYLM